MSVFLLFLIALTSVCFSTIFLMEQKSEEASSPTINKPSSIPCQRDSSLTVSTTTKDQILQEGKTI